jgi:hypothetical protein
VEFVDFPEALQVYGPLGLWAGVGLTLFRYLLTRQDKLAKQNLTELRKQLHHWKKRALRSELIVRAYTSAGIPVPRRELEYEVEVQNDLSTLELNLKDVARSASEEREQ